jgi:trk system potassium uptake protein TrkA
MEILIVGAGKVGYHLAKELSKNHNVTIIDNNEKALEKINENLDVLTIKSDIRNPILVDSLKSYDYLIAVTDDDELNIVTSLILNNKLKIKNSIIRLLNTQYIASLHKIVDSKLIFPYIISANSIKKLMSFPKANNIKSFPFTDKVLVSIKASESVKIENNENVEIIGVERGEEFIFFNQNEEIQKDDLVYIFGDENKIKEISYKIDKLSPVRIEKATIFGANELGLTIANMLNEMDIQIKVVEKDPQKAYQAANILDDEIEVINASYDDDDFFVSSGIQYSDVAITAFLHDEENIIKSLKAKKLGIRKVITINNNLNYYSIMHSLNLSTIRGPKIAAYYNILEDIDSQFLVYERFFLGSKGKIFIKKIFKPQSLTPPKEYAKIIILRDRKIVKDSKLEENDLVIEFNLSGNRKWIETL